MEVAQIPDRCGVEILEEIRLVFPKDSANRTSPVGGTIRVGCGGSYRMALPGAKRLLTFLNQPLMSMISITVQGSLATLPAWADTQSAPNTWPRRYFTFR